MIWQDLVFMIGGFVFAPSLVIAIWKRQPPPPATSLPTAIVLTVYLACYVSMHFWLAFASTVLTALCWYILYVQARRVKRRATRDLLLEQSGYTEDQIKWIG